VAELKEAIKHEDKDSISIAEEIGIQNGDLVAVMADSNKREGMEWSDNSSKNLLQNNSEGFECSCDLL
jgi:hypothetical protein